MTQGDLVGIATNAIGVTMMNIMLLAMENDNNRMVGYVDHINAAGKLRALIKS